MGSLDYALTRQALAEGVVRQVNNDEAIGVRLRYVGTGTVTSVTTTTATDVEMITSDGGTDTYAFATYTTIGSLVDAINADGIFEARVIDCLRSEGSASFFVDGAISSGSDKNGVVVWDMLVDTSGAATMAICLSPKGVDWDAPEGHRVHLREFVYNVDLTAAADSVQVWRRKNGKETQIMGLTSVDATETTVNFASGEGKLTGDVDEELIVFVTGTVVNAAGNLIRVVGEKE